MKTINLARGWLVHKRLNQAVSIHVSEHAILFSFRSELAISVDINLIKRYFDQIYEVAPGLINNDLEHVAATFCKHLVCSTF